MTDTNNIQSQFIIPLCIYTFEDENTNTFLGYLGLPDINKLSDGTFSYKCGPEVPQYFGWKYKSTFYAISPFLRPIPIGMRLYCAKIRNGFPYNTTDILDVYDPYQPFENCVNFITYSEPVPNTVPLYIHKTGLDSNDNPSCFPSFDPTPPKGYNNKYGVSVVYVMTPESIQSNVETSINYFDTKFSCINGRCMPWGKTEFGYPKLSLIDCIIQCNQIGDRNKPKNILEIIKENTEESLYSNKEVTVMSSIDKYVYLTPYCKLVFVLCMFIIILYLFYVCYSSLTQK